MNDNQLKKILFPENKYFNLSKMINYICDGIAFGNAPVKQVIIHILSTCRDKGEITTMNKHLFADNQRFSIDEIQRMKQVWDLIISFKNNESWYQVSNATVEY